MNNSERKLWVRCKQWAVDVAFRHPVAILLLGVAYLYLADCLVAHKRHADVPWIESGIYCSGPFGFVATITTAVMGIYVLVKRGL